MSPLNSAIEAFDVNSLAELITAGADVNEADPDLLGIYPLQLAVDIEAENSCRRYEQGDFNAKPEAAMTRFLLAAGASPDLLDPNGSSARSWARERLHEDALAAFESITSHG